MSAVVEFVSPAEQGLEVAERICDLTGLLGEIDKRLASLEKSLAECAGTNPLVDVLAKLEALENKVAALELRQRRPVPLTVIQNHRLDPDERAVFNELQVLFNRLDREVNQRMAAFNSRLDRIASHGGSLRKRLTDIENKGA